MTTALGVDRDLAHLGQFDHSGLALTFDPVTLDLNDVQGIECGLLGSLGADRCGFGLSRGEGGLALKLAGGAGCRAGLLDIATANLADDVQAFGAVDHTGGFTFDEEGHGFEPTALVGLSSVLTHHPVGLVGLFTCLRGERSEPVGFGSGLIGLESSLQGEFAGDQRALLESAQLGGEREHLGVEGGDPVLGGQDSVPGVLDVLFRWRAGLGRLARHRRGDPESDEHCEADRDAGAPGG